MCAFLGGLGGGKVTKSDGETQVRAVFRGDELKQQAATGPQHVEELTFSFDTTTQPEITKQYSIVGHAPDGNITGELKFYYIVE